MGTTASNVRLDTDHRRILAPGYGDRRKALLAQIKVGAATET